MERNLRVDYRRFTNCLRITIVPDEMQDERIEEIKTFCLRYGFENVMLFFNAEEYNLGHITKEELLPWLETIKKAKRVFEQSGLSVSLNPWIEMGHLDRGRTLKEGQNFTTMVDKNGKACKMVACPLCEEWQSYYFNLLGWYLKEVNPDFLWIEDDFRLHNHAPLEYGGCFCDLHMQKFNEKLGANYTREQFVQKVFSKGKLNAERKAWLEVNEATMSEISEKIGTFIKGLGLRTRVGLMSSAPWSHALEGRNWKTIHQNLSAGEEKIDRIHLPSYHELCGKEYGRLFNAVSMSVRALLPDDTYIYPELENGSFSNFTKDARFLQFQLESSIPLLPVGMTYDIYDFVGNGIVDEFGYGQAVKAVTPYLQGVVDLQLKFSDRQGLTLPLCEKAAYHAEIETNWKDLYNLDAYEIFGYLNGLGVNVKSTTDPNVRGETLFLTGATLPFFTDEQVKELFLYNFVIVDGGGVLAIEKRGLGELIALKTVERYPSDSGKQAYEQSAEILTVGGKKGYKASCLEKAGDYVKIEYAKDVTALSRVYTPTREYFGLGAVETDRFAVIPYILSGLLFEQYNPLRREILYAVLKKRQKNYIQTGVGGVQPYLYKRGEGLGFALMLVNYTVNSFEKTAFSTDIPFQKLLCVSRTGDLLSVPFERSENAVVAYLPLSYLSTATLLLLP